MAQDSHAELQCVLQLLRKESATRLGDTTLPRKPHNVFVPSSIPQRLGPGPAFPTVGNAGFALDFVETAKIANSGFAAINACYTDVFAGNALARIVEGPIGSLADLQAAEAALQAMVFHDHVSIITPALLATGQFDGFVRAEAERPRMAFDIFKAVESSDELIVVEHVEIADGDIVSTTLEPSGGLVGRQARDIGDQYLDLRSISGATIVQVPPLLGVSAYFSDPRLQPYLGNRGFSGRLYEVVGASLAESSSIVPGSEVEVQLPPLLWALLNKAHTRDQIPDAIVELRSETEAARNELRDLDARMQSAVTQTDREDTARYFLEAFDAVVPYARQTNVQRRQQVIYQMIEFARAPIDITVRLFNPEWRVVSPRRLVYRSVAAKTFSELLDTDIVKILVDHFLSIDEVERLEREARQSQAGQSG